MYKRTTVLLIIVMIFASLNLPLTVEAKTTMRVPGGEHPNNFQTESFTVDEGRLGIEAESEDPFHVFVFTNEDYEEFEENYSRKDLSLLDGIENKTHVDETLRVGGDGEVVFVNPGNESISVEYNVFFADDSTILWAGLAFCGAAIFLILLVGVGLSKYKGWLKKKTRGWIVNQNVSEKENIDKKKEELEQEVEELKKELEDLKNEKSD